MGWPEAALVRLTYLHSVNKLSVDRKLLAKITVRFRIRVRVRVRARVSS